MTQSAPSAVEKAAKVIHEAIDQLAARRAALLQRKKDVEDRANALLQAPLAPAEMKAVILGEVQVLANMYPSLSGLRERLAACVSPAGQRPVPVLGQEHLNSPGRGPLNTADLLRLHPGSGQGARAGLLMGMTGIEGPLLASMGPGRTGDPHKAELLQASQLCFFFGDLVREALGRHVDRAIEAVRHSLVGELAEMPASNRREALQELTDELGQLVEQLAAVDQELAHVPGGADAPAVIEARHRLGLPSLPFPG